MSGAYGGRVVLDAPASRLHILHVDTHKHVPRTLTSHHLNHAVLVSRLFSCIGTLELNHNPSPASLTVQFEIIAPGLGELGLPLPSPRDNVVYHVRNLPLSVLLGPEIAQLLRTGQLIGTSVCAPLDQGPAAALLPHGLLVLNLDKETYEHLGLVGHRSNFHRDTQRHGEVEGLLEGVVEEEVAVGTMNML